MSDDDNNLFSNLSERERKVLKDRFGIDLDLPLPGNIENQFDITRESIKRIEEKALKKINAKKRGIEKKLETCSFCNKPYTEVKKVIETKTGISICNECAVLCSNLIKD